ncbi:MAG: hypothetical protein E2O78_07560 [Caldithrix sp.]|nr:MAG: hypothetical protein E2O78_07560 [Caldithrix sp.]
MYSNLSARSIQFFWPPVASIPVITLTPWKIFCGFCVVFLNETPFILAFHQVFSYYFHNENGEDSLCEDDSIVKELTYLLSWLVLLLYAVSFWNYLRYFKEKSEALALQIRRWLLVAVSTHTIYLAMLTFLTGHLPVGNTFMVLASSAWFFVVVYLVLEVRLHEMTMGVFFLPVILLLQFISNSFIDVDKPLNPILSGMMFEVHVALMISAYAAFTISFITSVMYILLSREMQSKRLGIFFERLPSLQFFDNLSNHAVNIGLVIVTIGIGMGFYMAADVWEGKWALDPKLLAVVVSWGIYLVHFLTRKSIGWQGKRAAIVSVVGFNWLLFSFIIVTTFFSKIHNFQ